MENRTLIGAYPGGGFFDDIFKGNALNNDILPVQVSEAFLQDIFKAIENDNNVEIEVNLEAQTIKIVDTDRLEKFDIDPYKKLCLQSGYDDLDYLVSIKDKIEKYEQSLS